MRVRAVGVRGMKRGRCGVAPGASSHAQMKHFLALPAALRRRQPSLLVASHVVLLVLPVNHTLRATDQSSETVGEKKKKKVWRKGCVRESQAGRRGRRDEQPRL